MQTLYRKLNKALAVLDVSEFHKRYRLARGLEVIAANASSNDMDTRALIDRLLFPSPLLYAT
jgi:hypothetical protein